MYGPAYGHNIEPFFEFFQHHKEYKLSFIYAGNDLFAKDAKYACIKFLKLSLNPISILKLILEIRKQPNLMWIHASSIYHLLFLNFFRSKKTILNINIWSEKIPRLALGNSFKGKLWKYILNKANYVQCNWYGTQNLVKKIRKDNVLVFPWGLHQDYFNTKKKKIGKIASNFVAHLPKDKIKFFYPKSITFASDHIAVVDAVNLLVKKNIENFIVYFWMGNILDKEMETTLITKINKLKLNDYIKIKHPNYIPYNDIKYIWSKMDVGMQIAIFDQFSTSVIEPMLMKKELIITDIFPYRKLNDLYPDIKLKLIKGSAENIAQEMIAYIQGNKTKDNILESRKKIVETNFNFNKNLQKMLAFYKNLIPNKI